MTTHDLVGREFDVVKLMLALLLNPVFKDDKFKLTLTKLLDFR